LADLDVEKKLDDSLKTFADEVRAILGNSSFDSRQRSDLEDLMRQVFYTLNDFKKIISGRTT